MSFSIYDLDPSIRRLLTLDNFLDGMTVNEFIEELSRDHFLKGAEVNKLEYLDPKPYIRTFESTLRELKRLNAESEEQKLGLEQDVETYELQHSKSVISLQGEIDNITQQFSALDNKISKVTTKIDPLGQSLNKITNSRDRSTETIFLIRAYHGFFTKGGYEPLEKLNDSPNFDDKIKCAKTCVNLLTLAKKIVSSEIPQTSQCVTNIEKFNEYFETELLKKFENHFERDEYDKMREIASILYEFNGGATVVQIFVSKNDFVLESDSADDSKIIDNEEFWIQLNNPNFEGKHGAGLVKDDSTDQLLNRLRMSIKAQARIVQQVFESSTPVLKIFIQRIYAQIIQLKISTILGYSLTIGSLAHVRMLHSLFVSVGDFNRELKDFLSTNDLDPEDELGMILDQCYYDSFIDYTSEDIYFSREKKNLEETIYGIVSKFNSFHEQELGNRELEKKLEMLENLEYSAAEKAAAIASASSSATTITANSNSSVSNITSALHDRYYSERRRLSQFKTFMKTHLDNKPANSPLSAYNEADYEEYSELNITIVETVVKLCIESIARVLELTPNKTPDFALEILEILLFDFGKLYIGSCLEVSFEAIRQQQSFVKSITSASSTLSNPPHKFKFGFLATFNLTTEALFLISSSIRKILLPCAVNAPQIRNRMCNLTNSYISRCETAINVITQETLDLILGRITFLLTKQKKKDFVVENITDEEDTEACEEVSDFLIEIHEKIPAYLNNANLNNFLIKVGLNFVNQLLEHYKKFPVNSTGGIILTKDIIRFQSVIDQWKITELLEQFLLLREVGNLFTVHPDLINSLVTEGQLANLKAYSIRQYVSKRTDFNPSYIERFFSLK